MADHIDHPLIKPHSVEERLYQQVIAGEAIAENTLVVLPTALGKTVIALLVTAYVLHRYPEGRVLMLAPTRPLVLQHRDSFAEFLNLDEGEVLAVTGKDRRERREELWSKGRVLFATPQVVRNDMESGTLDPSELSLVIFDEAHRGVKKYAYTDIARSYIESHASPLVLALTASPGGDRERLERVCQALHIESIAYRNEEDPDVKPYIPGTRVEWREVNLPGEYKRAAKLLREMVERRAKKLQGAVKKPPSRVTKGDLVEAGKVLQGRLKSGGKKGPVFSAIVQQSAALSLAHALEVLQTQGSAQCLAFMEKLEAERKSKKSYANVVKDGRYPELKPLLEEIAEIEHPKVKALLEEVEGQLQHSPESRVLVFTQIRDTAARLVEALGECGIDSRIFVGQASTKGVEGMTQDDQRKTVEGFREGEFKVMVATSIGEEGLDIPNVDLVVFYEPVPSEIRFIQRRGRTGRKAPGKTVILAARGTPDIAFLHSSRKKEEKMRKMLEELSSDLETLERRRPPRKSGDERVEEGPGTKPGVSLRKRKPGQRSLEDWAPAPLSGEGGGNLYSVVVERMHEGGAEVSVNDTFRARLEAEEFPEPSNILKEGARFRVRGSLYRQGGVLHIRPVKILP